MELVLSVRGFMPGLSFRLGRFECEVDWPFVKVGKRSVWVEKTGHRPAKGWVEVWHADTNNTHVFAFGRRLVVSREE